MADCETKYMKAWRTISKEGRKAGYNAYFFFWDINTKQNLQRKKLVLKVWGGGSGLRK